jgi:alkylation response protein AidB-like acyl-CoA dehydrogenase
MDFSWSDEQISLRDSIISFAKENLNQDLLRRDQEAIFDSTLWEKCADFGIQGISVPLEYGGSTQEVDISTGMMMMEGLGYGCRDNGLTFGLNAHIWTVQFPIVQFGTEQQKKKFLPEMVAGKSIGAHALTEEEAGSDIFSMSTTAEKTDGGYLLNGKKRLVTFAPIADIVLVFANSNPKLGKWGITPFLVEKGMEGFSSGPVMNKMGLRTVPLGELYFKDCFVPEENCLGGEGSGFSLINHSLEYERICILACQLGAMQRQLEEAIHYTREREQFGDSIGKFQSVSNRIVNMKLRLETSRLLLHKVAWLKKTDQPAMLEAALLKLHLSESFVESSLDAIRTYGGSGYLPEFTVERDLRDSIGGILYAGTSDIQRNIVARLLGL